MNANEIKEGVNYHNGKKNYRVGLTKWEMRRFVVTIINGKVVYRNKNGDGLTTKMYEQPLVEFAAWAKGEF